MEGEFPAMLNVVDGFIYLYGIVMVGLAFAFTRLYCTQQYTTWRTHNHTSSELQHPLCSFGSCLQIFARLPCFSLSVGDIWGAGTLIKEQEKFLNHVVCIELPSADELIQHLRDENHRLRTKKGGSYLRART